MPVAQASAGLPATQAVAEQVAAAVRPDAGVAAIRPGTKRKAAAAAAAAIRPANRGRRLSARLVAAKAFGALSTDRQYSVLMYRFQAWETSNKFDTSICNDIFRNIVDRSELETLAVFDSEAGQHFAMIGEASLYVAHSMDVFTDVVRSIITLEPTKVKLISFVLSKLREYEQRVLEKAWAATKTRIMKHVPQVYSETVTFPYEDPQNPQQDKVLPVGILDTVSYKKTLIPLFVGEFHKKIRDTTNDIRKKCAELCKDRTREYLDLTLEEDEVPTEEFILRPHEVDALIKAGNREFQKAHANFYERARQAMFHSHV